ncbi:MAG TPA: DNA recombination protein RmuC, partial [Pantoea agglomerans]|nr:DNA recombination protein RmuC [Pantoea agglomerans]
RLWDKRRVLGDDMGGSGHSLDEAQISYREAMKELSEGRGKMIAQTEGFRARGGVIKRPINQQLDERAVPENRAADDADDDSDADESEMHVRRLHE